MKCPYCGEHMNRGIIQGGRFSYKWIAEEENQSSLPKLFSKGIKLTDPLMEHGITAFYCADCEKIVIDLKGKRPSYRT